MCRNNRRAARYQNACSSTQSATQQRNQLASGGVAAIIAAIQDIKLAHHGIDSKARFGYDSIAQNPDSKPQFEGVERGVVNDFPSAAEEKRQLQNQRVEFEVLPSYEESTESQTPQTQPRAMAAVPQATYDPAGQPKAELPLSKTQPTLLDGLETFRVSLLRYRQGARGAKHDTKRAAKDFVRGLLDQEMAKREAAKGHLECGERKQIKRDLKPVKQMLKTVVWEARRERMGRCQH